MTSIIRPDIPVYIATLPRILALGAQITTAGFTEPASLALARTKLDEVTALLPQPELPDRPAHRGGRRVRALLPTGDMACLT